MKKIHLSDSTISFIANMIVTGIFIIVGMFIGSAISKMEIRRETIEKGHAHFVITDEKTGATKFRWIDHEEKDE